MTKRVIYTAIILIVFFIGIFYNTVVLADEINLSNKKNLDNGKVNFQNISMKDGLSSNAITCIFQDSGKRVSSIFTDADFLHERRTSDSPCSGIARIYPARLPEKGRGYGSAGMRQDQRKNNGAG